jgi:hypothetical protein
MTFATKFAYPTPIYALASDSDGEVLTDVLSGWALEVVLAYARAHHVDAYRMGLTRAEVSYGCAPFQYSEDVFAQLQAELSTDIDEEVTLAA